MYSEVKNFICEDILLLCIGSEFAVLAVSLSLGRQKTECHAVQHSRVSLLPNRGIWGFVTTHFNTAVLTVHDLFQ